MGSRGGVRTLAAILCTLELACYSAEDAFVPSVPNPDGWPTEILIVGREEAEDPLWLSVRDRTAPPEPFRFGLSGGRFRFEAFLLPDPIADLGLTVGPQTLDTGEVPARFAAWSTVFGVAGAETNWTEETAPLWLDEVRVPSVDPDVCIERGGCLTGGVCRSTCGTLDAPTPPEPVRLPDPVCPEGWLVRDVGSEIVATACDALMEGPPCGDAEMRLPGEETCSAVGNCFGGEFPPFTAPVLRVATRGSASGDGSEMMPFATLLGAVEAAPPGAHIVVAAGAYPEPIVLDRPLTISGVCAETVQLGSIRSSVDLTLEDVTVSGLSVEAGTAAIRGTIVGGGADEGVTVENGAAADFERLLIRGAYRTALGVSGTIEGWDLAIRGARDGVRSSGMLDVTNMRVETATRSVFVENGVAHLSEVAVRAGGLEVEGELALEAATISEIGRRALRVTTGTVTLTDTFFFEVEQAIFVNDGRMSSRNLVVEDASEFLFAVRTEQSDVEMRRTAIFDVAQNGMSFGGGTTLIEDYLVEGVGRDPEVGGRGLLQSFAPGFEAYRLHFIDVGRDAVLIQDVPTATITDVIVESAGMRICDDVGGLYFNDSKVYARRIVIRETTGAAIFAERCDFDLEDVEIDGAQSSADCSAAPGSGIHHDGGSTLMARFSIVDPAYGGIRLFDNDALGGSITLREGVVRGAEVAVEVNVLNTAFTRTFDRVDLSDNVTPLLIIDR